MSQDLCESELPKATRITVVTAQTYQMEQAYRKRRSNTVILGAHSHVGQRVHALLPLPPVSSLKEHAAVVDVNGRIGELDH